MADEFEAQGIEATMATMISEPVVSHIPVTTGGVSGREVRHF